MATLWCLCRPTTFSDFRKCNHQVPEKLLLVQTSNMSGRSVCSQSRETQVRTRELLLGSPSPCGRLLWRSWKVSSVPGARGAPAKHCLAREIFLQFGFVASCHGSVFEGVGPNVCCVHSLSGGLVALTDQISPPSCTELVQPSAQLVLAHFGMATGSPEQHERQQNENNFQPLVFMRLS